MFLFGVHNLKIIPNKYAYDLVSAISSIQWRLRDVARDLAVRSAALETTEAEAFRPLIAMLDAESDSKSLVRKLLCGAARCGAVS